MNTTFSIIIPAYNSAKTIGSCLETICRQTYTPYEVIVVNDGSTDNTVHKCMSYFSRLTALRIINKNNEGQFKARNIGSAQATGDYIIFLDSDDALEYNTLETLNIVCKKNKPDIIAFDYYQDPNNKQRVARHGLSRSGLYQETTWHLVQEAVIRGEFNTLWGKAYKRTIVMAGQARFESEEVPRKYGEDWYQNLIYFDEASSFFYVDLPLYFYRENNQSTTSKYSPEYTDDMILVLLALKRKAAEWGGLCNSIIPSAAAYNLGYLSELLATSKELTIYQYKHEFIRLNKLLRSYVCDTKEIDNLRIDRKLIAYTIFYNYPMLSKLLIKMVCMLRYMK